MTNLNSGASYVNDRRQFRTVSQYDQPNLFRLALTYELPVKFKGSSYSRRLANAAVGGWSVSSYYVHETGSPLSITGANGRPYRIANEVIGGAVKDRLGDRRDAQGRVLNPYFNIGAFQALPNVYTISPDQAPLNELRGPPAQGLNAFLFKSFGLREWLHLQVTLQAESITNSPAYSTPSTTKVRSSICNVFTESWFSQDRTPRRQGDPQCLDSCRRCHVRPAAEPGWTRPVA